MPHGDREEGSTVLVRVQHGTGATAHGLSGAEERVVTLLSSWTGEYHLPGLALVNVNVPEKTAVRQVDGLIFTPSGLIVLEVKGFVRSQPGTLTVPPNGAWTVDGEPAAVHTLTGLTPGDQVKAGVYAAKAALTGIDGAKNSFVTGLVVLVPQGRGLQLGDTGRAGLGIHVTLATQKDLRRVIRRVTNRGSAWTADTILAACRVLALDHLAPERAELIAEGFLDQPPAPTPPTVPPPRTTSPPPAPTRSRASAPARTASASTNTWSRSPGLPAKPPPDFVFDPITPPTPAAQRPRPAAPPRPPARPAARPAPVRSERPARRRRRVPWGLLIALTLICTIGITAAVLVGEMFAGR
ncbi:nuclease-related domain-containing protein [Amycolatopsis japonica]|uniref:nuclease-related domain-containing protein n=1 Tax=Amycolatopsis japonica TaxID=208439 RepID=UPI003672A225